MKPPLLQPPVPAAVICNVSLSADGSGFTLIELLVVIAIISILASMLLPALSQAQDASRTAVCKSNQSELAVASMNYSLDNVNWLNPLQTAVPNSSVETTYRVILWYYVAQMPKVFDCPAEQNAVYVDGVSAYDASYGGFALAPGTDWGGIYGVAGPYEKWNQSGIGVAGAHWIHVDGNPDPSAQVSKAYALRAADAGLLRRDASLHGYQRAFEADLVRRWRLRKPGDLGGRQLVDQEHRYQWRRVGGPSRIQSPATGPIRLPAP